MTSPSVLLITGTSKGLGRALAETYLGKGFQVIGCSRSFVSNGWEGYHHFQSDISDEEKVKKMFSEIRKRFGRLDILINNAGVHCVNVSALTPYRTVQDVFNTNVMAAFLVCREAARLMRKNRFGRIVNISTVAVPLRTVGTAVYGASKAALEQFSRVFAKEVASDGITVNTLGLSVVDHSGMAENLSEGAVSETLEATALKSRITVQNIVHAIDFLISEESGAVTSQTLYLGGIG